MSHELKLTRAIALTSKIHYPPATEMELMDSCPGISDDEYSRVVEEAEAIIAQASRGD